MKLTTILNTVIDVRKQLNVFIQMGGLARAQQRRDGE